MNKLVKILLIVLIVILVFVAVGYIYKDDIKRWFFKPTESSLDSGIESTEQLETPDKLEEVANNLNVPWSIKRLPDGDLLVTERTGTLLRIGENRQSFQTEGVEAVGEGGLLGVAIHPDFTQNNFVYLYATTRTGEGLTNRIERYVLDNNQLSDRTIILENIPGASYHDGGEIAFGPDGKLYAGTGDAGTTELAQDTSSLAGKILRLNDDGSIPDDNPFNNAVFSYGHRNVQGITWDNQNQLWATEHGPSGTQSGFDELNYIESGQNYGWPTIRGDEAQKGMRAPIAHSGADETWAPGGISFADGSLFFMGLRGSRIYQAEILDNNSVSIKTHFANEFGRLRASSVFDGLLYFSTSNTDGRGTPKANDDKVYSIPVSLFK